MHLDPSSSLGCVARRLLVLAALALTLAPALASAAPLPAGDVVAEVRRTTDDVAHVRANTWHGLGAGIGFAQAQDALCTLAEGFVTYAGRRAFHFGQAGRPTTDATFGRASNLDLDFFFQAFAGPSAVAAFSGAQPAALQSLVAGYADGYNRYLRVQGTQDGRRHACAGQPWVHDIDAADVYRRMIGIMLAGGYARFVTEIAGAQPPGAHGAANAPADPDSPPLVQRLRASVGNLHGLGSNAIAIGEAGTGREQGALFGNPHWFWAGPDRFHQAHLTLPGQLNVAGVAFLGAPVVVIGFNDHVAWSHTVSTARRFGLFELRLDPGDRTRYMVDGVSRPMQAMPLAVVARQPDGGLTVVRRTLYRTEWGPVIDFGKQDPRLGWDAARALAIRDVNETNFRAFQNFLRWGASTSLDEFIAIQRDAAAMPWVNTVAIGRDDGRVWYADVGAVPDVPDTLRETCAATVAPVFGMLDPFTPVLDGSRGACAWRRDPAAVQAGAMAAAGMPALLRTDYVANMNDSYWLSNPARPLEGFATNLGGERMPLGMRGREGHRIAQALLARAARDPGDLSTRMMRLVLQARAYPADHFRPGMLRTACARPDDAALRAACGVLHAWSGRAGTKDRGSILWDTWWLKVAVGAGDALFSVPFSSADPLNTPRDVAVPADALKQALREAVDELRRSGVALDAPLGTIQHLRAGPHRIAMPGGAGQAGYFTVSNERVGQHAIGPETVGNSYLQVVTFGAAGVYAHTLLAHGQRETAITTGDGLAPVARYAGGRWLRFAFHEQDIARAAQGKRVVLRATDLPSGQTSQREGAQ